MRFFGTITEGNPVKASGMVLALCRSPLTLQPVSRPWRGCPWLGKTTRSGDDHGGQFFGVIRFGLGPSLPEQKKLKANKNKQAAFLNIDSEDMPI